MGNNKFPIPPLAVYDSAFVQLTTDGCIVLRADSYAQLLVKTDALLGSTNTIYGYDSITDTIYPISVDDRGYVNINSSSGVQAGQCTNSGTTGEISYDETAFVTLDSISIGVGEKILVHSVIASATSNSVVELVTFDGVNTVYELKGVMIENSPEYNPNFGGTTIDVIGDVAKTLILRIKNLRKGTAQASGRIFARKV